VVQVLPVREAEGRATVTLHDDDTVWVGDAWDNVVQFDGDQLVAIADALLAAHIARGRRARG
jgi:hypothetical protein